jgi:xanthine dehydrogenase YagS FAD-binding subunit
MRDGICHDIRIVLGGVAPFPYIAYQAMERLKGEKLTEKVILQAADASVEKARPLPGNLYKIDLIKVLIARALKTVRTQAIKNNLP